MLQTNSSCSVYRSGAINITSFHYDPSSRWGVNEFHRFSWVTLPWQQWGTQCCQASPSLSHLLTTHSVAGAKPPPGRGGRVRRKKERRKWGRPASPWGANIALMTDASIALRWNWSGCDGKKKKRKKERSLLAHGKNAQGRKDIGIHRSSCSGLLLTFYKCFKKCNWM